MTIDNFELIKYYINYHLNMTDDNFLYLQIIRRKKDGNEETKSSQVLKSYTITSSDYLTKKEEEIKTLCETFNARAYINLNIRSFDKIQRELMSKLAALNLDYSVMNPYRLVNSVIGASTGNSGKYWLIDIDEKNEDLVNRIINCIKNIYNSMSSKLTTIFTVPTKSGYHIITSPFFIGDFMIEFPNIDVHKNCPTILYIP